MNLEKKLDVLKECFNIGVGGAAQALNKLIQAPIMISVPDVFLISLDEAIEKLGPLDYKVVSFYIKVSNNMDAGILMIIDEESAEKIAFLTAKKDIDIHSDFFIGVLKEVANIMTSYFLNTLSKMLKKALIPGVPNFACDMKGAVLDYVFAEHKNKDLNVVFVTTKVYYSDIIKVNYILIPEESFINEILKAL